MQLLTIAFLF